MIDRAVWFLFTFTHALKFRHFRSLPLYSSKTFCCQGLLICIPDVKLIMLKEVVCFFSRLVRWITSSRCQSASSQFDEAGRGIGTEANRCSGVTIKVFNCMQYLQDFHCFVLLLDITFRCGTEAIILLSWKPPDSFNNNSDSPCRESELQLQLP